MGLFSDHTDQALDDAIANLTARVIGGAPAIKVVAGEGRRLEYENSSASQLRRILREAKEERDARRGGIGGAAIGVNFNGR